jgi:predicted AlkP superfamily pyrophosphatase or phosphodiesterase
MRAALLILLVGLAGACGPARPEEPRIAPVEHVVIVSIDGFRPDFYLGDWETPVLKSIASGGARARAVEGVYPSTTYPSHATIATGVRPARHGIYANTVWTPQGSSRDWHWYARDLKARTLWQAAREAGRRTAITYWPVSVGAEADWVLGEIWDPEGRETVKRLVRSSSPGLLMELAFEVGIPAERIAESRAGTDDFVSKAAAYVFAKHKPSLQFVHLLEVDEAQHKHGPDAPEVREALRRQDARVGRIRKAIADSGVGARTVLLVVGDHGFTRVERNLNPNSLLRDAGFVTVEDGRVASWRALARASGGSAAIYVKHPDDEESVRDALLKCASVGGEVLFRVLDRGELGRLGYNPDAAFALEPAPGWALTGALAPEFIHGTASVKGNHGQLPDREGLQTGFLAEGPSVRPGSAVEWMDLTDIAPTVAALLGLDLPDAEGRVLAEIFRR